MTTDRFSALGRFGRFGGFGGFGLMIPGAPARSAIRQEAKAKQWRNKPERQLRRASRPYQEVLISTES